MTYTGLPPINFARDLPAAVQPDRRDIWLRTPTGDQALVTAAVRHGDNVTITVLYSNWPQADTTEKLICRADARISTRVY